MIYRAKAPLRISFSGGGTDIEPFKDEFGGLVLSTTINKYCYTSLVPRDDDEIYIKSHDYSMTVKYDANDINGDLKLVKTVIKRLEIKKGFDLYIQSDAPAGSGLGSSSTLVVSLLGLFQKWLNLSYSPYELAKLAYEIERIDMNIKGGWQDQYASVFGGFNYIEFYKDKIVVNPLRINNDYLNELERNLLLVYTGNTRMSDNIIANQINDYEKNLKHLLELKSLTQTAKDLLVTGKLSEFGSLLNVEWYHKKRLTEKISNPRIDELYEEGIASGAYGGKLVGAGSSGHLLFYCPDKFQVAKRMKELGTTPIDFNFDRKGMVAWSI